MDAIKLLRQHHREVEELFGALEEKTPRGRAKVVDELARKLVAHMIIEQRLFYPAVQEVAEDLVHESYEEHHLARTQVDRILCADLDDETFPAKVTALKELIAHHVEEEEKELFPKVLAKVDEEERLGLGAEMKTRFETLVQRRPRTLLARAEAADVLADVEAA